MYDYSLLANELYTASVLGTNDKFNAVRARIIAEIGYTEYKRIWTKVCLRINTQTYTFPDFSSKDSSPSSDKSYVGHVTPQHNED